MGRGSGGAGGGEGSQCACVQTHECALGCIPAQRVCICALCTLCTLCAMHVIIARHMHACILLLARPHAHTPAISAPRSHTSTYTQHTRTHVWSHAHTEARHTHTRYAFRPCMHTHRFISSTVPEDHFRHMCKQGHETDHRAERVQRSSPVHHECGNKVRSDNTCQSA